MYKKIFANLFAFLLIATTAAFAAESEVYTISAYGEGRITVAPDTARITFSVKNGSLDAKQADAENAKRARSVIAAVKNFGVRDDDVKTSRYTIYPTYSKEKNAEQRITGYFAENSLTVKIRDIKKAGEIIDAALNAGANQVSSLSFYKENTSALEKEAIALAVKNARERADIVAKALNVSIIGVKHATPNINHRSFETSHMMMNAAANSSTPIEGGSTEVTASVNVEFIIR